MVPSPDSTVGELASRFPQTISVFQRLGIEFCCDGGRMLGDVCRERQIVFAELAAALAGAIAAPLPRRQDWSGRPLTELTAHIVDAFHDPLRQELPRLRQRAAKVQHHQGPDKHVLGVVQYELERFNAELQPHMAAAERELFPLVERIDRRECRPGDAALFGQLRAALEADHAEAGHALQILRNVTNRYELPVRSCATLRGLYQGLRDLERLMQLHVHLENNVLFPRAAAQLAETRNL
jgi:regulator of cell morphogenesis and NO signaling